MRLVGIAPAGMLSTIAWYLLSPVAMAAKPKPAATVQFVYSVSDEATQKTQADDARFTSYAAQRAWLDTHEDESTGLPKEFRQDLNGDGHAEIFLRVLGHSHFAEYSIFTRTAGKWIYIGACDYGGVRLKRLVRAHGRWHDFSVDIEGSRGSLERRYFRFDPRDRTYDLSYIMTVRRESPDETSPSK